MCGIESEEVEGKQSVLQGLLQKKESPSYQAVGEKKYLANLCTSADFIDGVTKNGRVGGNYRQCYFALQKDRF